MLKLTPLVIGGTLAALWSAPAASAKTASPSASESSAQDKTWKSGLEREMASALAGYATASTEKDPQNFEIVAPSNPFVRGYLYFKRGDHAKAKQSFQRSIEEGSFLAESRYMLAAMIWTKHQSDGGRGDLDQAKSLLEQAIVDDPDYSSPYYLRGILKNYAGQPNEALEDLRRAVHLSRGTCYRIHDPKEINENWLRPRTKEALPGFQKVQESCAAEHQLEDAVTRLRGK